MTIAEFHPIPVLLDAQTYLVRQADDEPTTVSFVENLNQALEVASLPQTPLSTVSQLESGAVNLANLGVITAETGSRQEGPELLQRLQTTLIQLERPENQRAFMKWALGYYAAGQSEYQIVLRALVQTSAWVLDTPTLEKMYATSEGNMSVAALKALRATVELTIPKIQSDNISTLQIFDARFSNMNRAWADACSKEEFAFYASPHIDAVVDTAINVVKKTDADSNYTAQYILKYMQLSGLQNGQYTQAIHRFMGRFQEDPNGQKVCQILKNLAIDAQLIEDDTNGEIVRELKQERLRRLKTKDWKDLNDKNIADLAGDAVRVIYTLVPGSYAPMHLGHQQNLIERLQAYHNYLDRQDEQQGCPNGRAVRILMLMPLSDPYGIHGHNKRHENLATLEERAGAIGVELAHTEGIEISTQIPPVPRYAGNIVNAINITAERLIGKTIADFEERGKSISRDSIAFRVAVGADEYIGERVHGNSDKLEETFPNIIVGRYGYLGELIDQLQELTAAGATVIVTSGIKSPGSSEAICMLNDSQNKTPVASRSTLPYIFAVWRQQELDRRKLLPLMPMNEIPSFTEIMPGEVRKYEELLRAEGSV